MRTQTFRCVLLTIAATACATATVSAAERIKRQPLSLRLFLQPFKPQTVTPQIFGLLPENEYLQKELNLTPAQLRRMREIERQLTRVSTVLLEADVKKELALTEKQTDRIYVLRREAVEKAQKVNDDWKQKRKEIRAKRGIKAAAKELAATRDRLQKTKDECDEKSLGVLTEAQRKRFEQLLGIRINPRKIFNRSEFARTIRSPLPFDVRFRPYRRSLGVPSLFGILVGSDPLRLQVGISANQKQRMRQIELQLTLDSYLLIYVPEVKKELSITPRQSKRMEQLRKQYVKEARAATALAAVKLPEFQKTLQSIDKEANLKKRIRLRDVATKEFEKNVAAARAASARIEEKMEDDILNVLTGQQQQRFRTLKGKVIDPVKIFGPGTHRSRKPPRPDV